MTEKRFCSLKIYYGGEWRYVRDNNLIGEKSMTLQEVVDTLNELNDENQHIKNLITEAYANERTALGKSVLKQLLNNIGEI